MTNRKANTTTTVTVAATYTFDCVPHGATAGVTGPGLSSSLPVTYTGTYTVAGKDASGFAVTLRGVSNEKAKRELGWQPAHPSWRTGFAESLRGS